LSSASTTTRPSRWPSVSRTGYPTNPSRPTLGAADPSGVLRAGVFARLDRNVIKENVRRGELRLVVGTDAASEGLNLQRLGTLINLDLPWNPTRLEQRKGRIQRIGQVRDTVLIYNMRYRDSVEDRVHQLLSGRLQGIRDLFGQIPDTLEDVWVLTAMRDEQKALEIIDEIPARHPFEMRYDRVEPVDWESCAEVLDSQVQLDVLMRGWS
jgi:superfamily II DNA or RNA helicase